jgi:hypothetical protein
MKYLKILVSNMFRFFLGLVAFIIFGVACCIGYTQDKPAIVATLCAAAIFCLIFAFLSKFKKFKGLGIEAEMWEQVQKEAETMIKELRRLALITAAPVTRLSTTIGYWDSHYENKDLYDVIIGIEDSLSKNGVSKDEIENIKRPFHRRVVRSLCLPIQTAIYDKMHAKFLAAQTEINNRHPQPITDAATYGKEITESQAIINEAGQFKNFDIDETNFATAYEKLVNIFESCQQLTDEEKADIRRDVKTELEELEYYCSHKDFKTLRNWLDAKLS